MRSPHSSVVLLFLAAAFLAAGVYPAAAQTVVFNDTFGGSTINSSPTSPAAPLINKTAYQQISAKAFQTASVAAGHLSYGLPATSSAVNMIEALFTQYPVTLSNINDSIQLTITFTPKQALLDASSSGLFLGLFNSGSPQVQPLPGGQQTTAAVAGSAQNWQGYAARCMIGSGVTTGIFTRPAQTATATSNQDVCYAYASGVTVSSTANPTTFTSLAAGTQYTVVFTITQTGATALQIGSTLYQGADATGTVLFSQTGATSTIQTATYDALSIGFRAAAGATGSTHVQNMDVNSIKVTTTASTTVVPVITQQPLSQTVAVGDPVTFSVAASGGGASLSYQWKKDAADIPGATGSSYAIPSASSTDAGNYTVVVADVAGSTTSNPATLTVSAGAVAPAISQSPANATILVGGSNTFTASFTGSAVVTAKWQKSADGGSTYTDIAGTATSASPASYTIANAQLSDAGLYRLVAANAQGSATSAAATLTVNQAPAITTQPVGANLNPGDSYTLTVGASGTPAPTYQWYKNGAAIAGATGASLTLSNATGANTGNYAVVATNSVSSVTSAVASIAVLSQTLASTAFTVSPAAGLNPDARLSITFNQAVSYGVSGLIRIYDASTNSVVDTIDMVAATNLMNALRATSTVSTMAAPVQNKTVGGLSNFNYYPVIISGSTATIYPRNNVLTYGKTYYVTIDAGAFVDSAGAAYPGIAASGNTSAWTFSTRAAGPSASAATLTVAADGTGDFDTVQGALDFLPAGNTTARTLFIRKGTYFEQVYFTGKHSITFLGEDRAQTIVAYPNNNNFNNVSGTYHRATMMADHCNNVTVTNLTVKNSTPHGGAQAEALLLNGTNASQAIVTSVNCLSYQDTVQFNGQTYISNSYIEGDTDFMWGNGPNFYSNCQMKMLTTGGYFTQIRNPVTTTNHGNVYLNCTLTAASGVTGFLSRIDPNTGQFPFSEVVWINCTMGNFLNTTTGASGSSYNYGWYQLNNSTASTATTNLHSWDYNTRDASGAALTFSPRPAFTVMPTDAATISNYSTPSYVLGNNWTPSLGPVITSQPASQHVNSGQSVTLSVGVSAVPDAAYQWKKNGAAIAGATSASYTIASAGWADAASYSVTVTNASGTATSAAAALAIDNDPGANYVSGYNLDPATTGAPDADPDGDGLTNKMEFFLGANPTQSSSGSLPVSSTVTDASGNPTGLVFEFNRNHAAAGLAYTVEYTADLTSANWTTATDGVNGVTVSTTVVDASTDHVKVTIPSGAKLFARLHL